MDELQKLYNVVNQREMFTGSFEEFRNKFEGNPEQQTKLFEVVSSRELFTKGQNEFNKKYFPAPIQTSETVKKKDDTTSLSANTELGTLPQETSATSVSENPNDISSPNFKGQLVQDIDAGKFDAELENFSIQQETEKQRVNDLINQFESKTALSEDDIARIEQQELEEDNDDFGFFGDIGNAIRRTPLVGSIPNPFFAPQKAGNLPEKIKIREDLAKSREVDIKNISDEDVDEIFKSQRRDRLEQSRKDLKTEEFIEDISEDDKNTLTREFTFDLANLSINNQRILLETESNAKALESKTNELKEIIENHDPSIEYSSEYFDNNKKLADDVNDLLNDYEENLDQLNKNEEDLASVSNEVDLFKRNYNKFYNFKEKAINSFATLGANAIHFINEGVKEIKDATGTTLPMDVILYQNIKNDVVDATRDSVRRSEDTLTRRQSLGDIDGITDIEGITEWALDTLAEQTANTVVLVSTGGTSGLVALGVSSAGAKLNELQEEERRTGQEFSKIEKWTVATLTGTLEGVTEKISLGQLNKARRVFKSVPFNQIRRSTASYIKNNAFKDLKEYSRDIAEETLGEVINDLGSKFSEQIFLGKDVNYTENLDETIMSSIFMSGLVYKAPQIGSKVRNVFTSKDNNQKIAENSQQILDLTEQINNATSESVIEALENKKIKLANENLDIINGSIDNLDNLTDDDKKELIDINNKVFDLRKQYFAVSEDTGIDNKTKEGLLNDLVDERNNLELEKDGILKRELSIEVNGKKTNSTNADFENFLSNDDNVKKIIDGNININITNNEKASELLDKRISELSTPENNTENVTEDAQEEVSEFIESQDGENIFNPLESEGESIGRLSNTVNENKSIDDVAQEHTDSYLEYLEQQGVGENVLNSEFVNTFKDRLVDALNRPNDFDFNQERSQQNGSRIDSNGELISEVDYLTEQGSIEVSDTETDTFSGIDSIIESEQPSVISTDLNDYNVEVENGTLNITPRFGNNEPSRSEIRKITNQYIEQTDFDSGQRVNFDNRGNLTQSQISEIISEESQNAIEVAQEIQNVKENISDTNDSIQNSKEGAISNSLQGVQVDRDSFSQVDDANNLSDVNPFYFSSRNKQDGVKTIDQIREIAQQNTNEEIELEDITDFIKENRNPNNIIQNENDSTSELESRFQEITGLKATDSNINAVLDNQSKPNQEQESNNTDDSDDTVPFQTESNQERIQGEELNNLVNRLKITGLANDVQILNDSKISSFLENLGIENINDSVQLSSKGVTETPNGFVYNGIVYLNSSKVKKDTPIHEFGHLWNSWAKENNSNIYNRGLELIKDSEYHKQVKNNPAYNHLSEESQLEESLAQAIGEKGVKILKESKKSKFNTWFKSLFTRIAKGLGITSLNPTQLSNLNLDKFTDLVGAELLSGQQIIKTKRPQVPKNRINEADVSNIDLVISEQIAIKKTKDDLIKKFRDRNTFGKDIKNELVKYIQSNIDSKRISQLQKSELNKLLNLVRKAKTKKNLLDAFNKVNDIVTTLDNKNLVKKINNILNKKFSKKESGRRKANITNEETEIILNKIKENITDLKSEDIATPFKPTTTNRINERLDNLYGIREALELNDGDLSEIEGISISINILNALNTKDVNNANDLLNESLADIESIFEDGRSSLKEAREKRKLSDEFFLNELENDANPDGKTSNKSVNALKEDNQNTGNVVSRTLKRAFHNWFRGRITASLDSIATIISKKGGENRDSSAWVQFVNNLKRQETSKKARIRKFANKWNDIQVELFGSLTKADKLLNKFVEIDVQVLPEDGTETVTEKVRYTYSQLLNVWQNNHNEKLRAGLANNGFTKEVIEEIDKILPQKVKDYGNSLFDLYNEMYEDSNEVYKSLNFHSLGKPPFYAGKVNREGVSIKEDTDALLGGVTSINTTGYASQKERVNNDKKINAVDVNLLFNRSLQESSHYVAFAEIHRLYNKLLNNNDVQKAILLNNGKSGDQVLKSLLYYKVRDVEQGGERGNKVVDALGRNIARSVLGLKAKIGITQTISIINGSFDLPRNMKPKDFIDNYNPSEVLKNVRFLMNNSEYMKNRYGVGGLENAVLGLENITKQSSFKFDDSNLESKRRASARFYKRATDFLLLNVKFGDMVGVLGATPVYSAWKTKFINDGLSEEKANEKALAKFEASVDRAQQSISSFGKSEIQKHPYLRYLMMFATAPIQNLQNANFHRRELVKGLRGQESKGSNLRNAIAFMNYQFAQPMLYTYISNILAGSVINAIGGLGEDDESTEADKALLSSAVLGNVQSVPLIGGILLYTIDKVVLQKEHTFANVIGSPLYDEIKKTEDNIKKAIESKKPETRKKHIFEAIKKTSGILGGIPNFSFDVFNEWDDVYWNDDISDESKVYRALGYSKPVIKNKTEENLSKKNSRGGRNTR